MELIIFENLSSSFNSLNPFNSAFITSGPAEDQNSSKNQFYPPNNTNTKKAASSTPDKKDFSKQTNSNYNTRSSINAFDSLINASKNRYYFII